MAKEPVDISFLDNPRITFIGADAPHGNYVTRAVFKLAGDITPAMPHLSRVIDNCGYNPDAKTLAFRVWNMPVVVGPDTITVNDMRDMKTAQMLLDWLKEKLKEAG